MSGLNSENVIDRQTDHGPSYNMWPDELIKKGQCYGNCPNDYIQTFNFYGNLNLTLEYQASLWYLSNDLNSLM